MTGRQRFVRTESEGEGTFMLTGEALQYKVQPVFFITPLATRRSRSVRGTHITAGFIAKTRRGAPMRRYERKPKKNSARAVAVGGSGANH